MVPIILVHHMDEVFVTVTIGLSIPMRRTQNCAQHMRGSENIN